MKLWMTRKALRPLSMAAAVAMGLSAATAPATAQLDSFFDKMKGMFGADETPQPPAQQPKAPEGEPPCPTVDIRNGASTLTTYGSAEQAATNVRYQATFAQTARECTTVGGTMTVKLGVRGRIILGPLGGPGQITVPLRIALVKEGPEPKTLLSKFHQVPVTIPPNDTNVPFTYVDPELTFPVVAKDDMEAYIFYVGFDEQGMKEPRKPAKKPRAKKPTG